ncbi:DUF1189 domain-containing protein [Aeribacillus composti]|uniref:DUF1189 domain-containing protein n=1 Tax=Aeribacillus composti TaxID=1868734 RepID=UPI00406A28CA
MNLFVLLFKSIYSPKTIALTRFQKIGKPILYGFLLAFLAALPNCIYLNLAIVNAINGLDQTINEKIPEFTIHNGTLKSEENAVVKAKHDQYTIIFDPKGTFTRDDLKWQENVIGILSNEFVFVSNGTMQQLEYNFFQETEITKEDLTAAIKQLSEVAPIIIPVISVTLFAMSATSKFVEITFLAIVGLLFKKRMGKRLNFKQLWTISAYSVTLASVFFAIMNFFLIDISFALYINWFVHITVLYLVLKEIPSPKQPVKAA